MDVKLNIRLAPITKKNHSMIARGKGGRPFILPSKQYRDYEQAAIDALTDQWHGDPIEDPVNVEMVFFMPTMRRCDLVNLQEACLDVLVRSGVLKDDCSGIVARMDGSEVRHDKNEPRTEIRISEVKR
jgi:Holliday junction resolvase RusA-like endonuclease